MNYCVFFTYNLNFYKNSALKRPVHTAVFLIYFLYKKNKLTFQINQKKQIMTIFFSFSEVFQLICRK
ncbi:hypothetical protein AZH43_04705 [Acinetobacter pragensis]|uniref:Uncharacterized protein n=1 Tax=Acinetobacter pragensis TaxID=1806892 RepID=A0A151XXG0_9GAMM|nr:hypothetical protein AZH43_04705 [Acinetobacter pragensis]